MDDFLRVARLSGLVDSDRLDEATWPWRGVTGPVPEACLLAIIERGLLTAWQMEQLRKGRHKGFVISKYKLLRLLGAGRMSSVYLAEHMTLHNEVAIKVLPVTLMDQPSYLARFEREAQSSARLNHPHIARGYDLDTTGSIRFIVREYIDGIDLYARARHYGPLPIREAADFIRQAALGLHYAHEEGFVHRDIKPSNLMVDKRGHVTILDLGLALAYDDDEEASLTKEHDEKVLGTADYLSPEQARDSHKADRRSDIYSLGCTLYYLLVGKAPFAKGSLAERIRAHMNEPAPNLLDARPDVPAAIVELYFRMMEKHPDARQQTAQEVADSLSLWLAATAPSADSQRPELLQRKSLHRTYDASPSAESLRRPSDPVNTIQTPSESPRQTTQQLTSPLPPSFPSTAGDALVSTDVIERVVHGRYRLIAELGVGGMGVTYRAWDTHAGAPVVVKMPKKEVRHDREVMARFSREIDAMRSVPHESIVPITDSGIDDGCPYVVMRFLPGGSLADYRRRDESDKPIKNPPGMLHFWLPGVAAALDHIHTKGMLHRDVKPGNVFLDGFLKPYLGDFGIAKVVDESGGLAKEQTLTATTAALGTPEYMAPELFRPASLPDGRIDQYALAVTVYEMVSGEKPFKGNVENIVVEHATIPVPPIHRKCPGLSRNLSTVLERGLAKNAKDRFATCSEFAAAVLAELAALPPEPDTVRLLCPECKNILKLRQAAAGKSGTCPRCQAAIDVADDLGSLWLESENRSGYPDGNNGQPMVSRGASPATVSPNRGSPYDYRGLVGHATDRDDQNDGIDKVYLDLDAVVDSGFVDTSSSTAPPSQASDADGDSPVSVPQAEAVSANHPPVAASGGVGEPITGRRITYWRLILGYLLGERSPPPWGPRSE